MSYICGIDEAGRGPLAGPVTAAAVILGPETSRELLLDSKLLSAKKREVAAAHIEKTALYFGVGWADNQEIDALNIHHATLLAMRRAYEAMLAAARSNGLESIPISRVLVDGKYPPELSDAPQPEAIIGGDRSVPAISAASILAKTRRDSHMVHLDQVYPDYGFKQHKGYPTVAHRKQITLLGPSPVHRLSFRLVPSRSAS